MTFTIPCWIHWHITWCASHHRVGDRNTLLFLLNVLFIWWICTVVLHERGPLFRILGPPKQQVSNIFKKFQSAGRSLLMMHENLHFSKQILHNFFQNFLFSIPWKIHEKPLSFCQPFYWPWIFNLHFSLEPGIVEACNMAHLNPVSLKINLVGWNPPFMPLSWSKCEKTEFFQYFSRRWARCFRLEMSLENMF